jgi:hypothetical protein
MNATETMNYYVDPSTGLPSTSSSAVDATCVSNHDDGDDDQEMMDCQSLSSTEAEDEAIHRTRVRTAAHTAECAQQAQQYQRPEPERGVKKTASLRRGGAVYDQLLQSAVMASIESRKDEQGQGGGSVMDDDVVASFANSFSPTSPIGRSAGGTMQTTNFYHGNDSASMDDTSMTSPGKKKRTGGHLSDFQGPAGFGTPPRSKSQKQVIPSAGVVAQAAPTPFHPGSPPNHHHQPAFQR